MSQEIEMDAVAEAAIDGIEAGLKAYDDGDSGAALAMLLGMQVGRCERAEYDRARLRGMLAELLIATSPISLGHETPALEKDLRPRAMLLLKETR
jgi:hypothetical protein